MKKKRKEKKQQQLKPHESSLRKHSVESQQMHDLRDRNLAAKRASPKQAELIVKWANILQCLCNATIQEKKKKTGNS